MDGWFVKNGIPFLFIAIFVAVLIVLAVTGH
jgi:hypothetical protein